MNLAPHHVKREEIIDYQTYSETRDEIRKEVMRIKAPRRIHLGQYLTFLFENHETIKYQIQEITPVFVAERFGLLNDSLCIKRHCLMK